MAFSTSCTAWAKSAGAALTQHPAITAIAFGMPATGTTLQHRRKAAAVAKYQHLFAALQGFGNASMRQCAQAFLQALMAQVNQLHQRRSRESA